MDPDISRAYPAVGVAVLIQTVVQELIIFELSIVLEPVNLGT